MGWPPSLHHPWPHIICIVCQKGPPISSEPELSTLFRRLRALGHCKLHWTFFGKHYFDWEAQVLSIPLFWNPWWMLLCLIGNILLHHFSSFKSKSARIQQYSVTSDVPYRVKIWFKKVCSYNPSSGKCIIQTSNVRKFLWVMAKTFNLEFKVHTSLKVWLYPHTQGCIHLPLKIWPTNKWTA